jgi:hypothetical protein
MQVCLRVCCRVADACTCVGVRVLTMRLYTACVRVRRALLLRLSMEHTHAPLTRPRVRPHVRGAPPCVDLDAHASAAKTVRALSVGVDRVWLGSQAFNGASAFNANIGAWNTASVSSMDEVGAALGPAARHRGGRARPGLDAARPSPPMRAHTCAHAYRHWLAWASACGCVAARRLRSDSS